MPKLLPLAHQAPLPLEKLLLKESPSGEAIEMDVVIVGAGPSGLATAIELARLAKADPSVGELQIAVLEKAGALGEHTLSGACVNPRAFRELFPELKDEEFPFKQKIEGESVYFLTEKSAIRTPTPPPMHNAGNYVGSLCEMVRWLGGKAEELGVNLFTGFPVDALFVEGNAVKGVRTTPTGLDRDGVTKRGDYAEPTDLTAKVTVLSEGTRGPLAQAWRQWQGVTSENPQIFALGVKEIWEVKRPLDRIIHTLGYPVPLDAFGGTFVYPQGKDKVALGVVVGLDHHDARFDAHVLLQKLKLHPMIREILEGGTMLEWGAKTIPEGGWYALAERHSGDGVVMTGDTAGFVDVPSLKGVHYAMQSGIYAARAIFQALKGGDTSAKGLAPYDTMVNESYIKADMYRTRNMRLAFKDGFFVGSAKAGLMTVTGGRFPGGRIAMHADAEAPREVEGAPTPFVPDNVLTFGKLDAVFKSGNATRDTIPQHLIVGKDVSAEVAEFYTHLCPAGVYEVHEGTLRVNAPNCVDCKATDVVGPRWTPREGGSGPKYRLM